MKYSKRFLLHRYQLSYDQIDNLASIFLQVYISQQMPNNNLSHHLSRFRTPTLLLPFAPCQFLRSHNCAKQIFFSKNVPKSQSRTRHLSFNGRRNYWLTSQTSVLRPPQLLMTHVPDVCPPTVTETKCCHLSAPSKTRIEIMSSLSYQQPTL